MNHSLKTFRSEQFGEVRSLVINDCPWFAASDVCKALEVKNAPQALSRLDDDERFTTIISNDSAATGKSKLSFVNEAGLYSLILSSRKPEAKAFKRWITHEVIPAIRKHGIYATNEALDKMSADPRLIEVYRKAIAAEREQKDLLLTAVAEMHPKAEYYDAFIHPYECTNIRIAAKELHVPERKFVRYLLQKRYLFRSPSGQLLPYAKHEKNRLFLVKDYCRNGHMDAYTLFTPAGKDFFRQLVPEILETEMPVKAKH